MVELERDDARDFEELFGVQPGKNWGREYHLSCPFGNQKEHVISKHPKLPWFWCANCHRSWLERRGADPVMIQRIQLLV